nr:ribonuclease H-like domain-containing protein [Tanacetum cinerariifolium]
MAQQIILAAQLVCKFQGIRKCNNYVVLQISKVPDTKDTIRFKLDTQDIVYTIDMFCDTIKLPVETPNNLFVAPVNIEINESFMHTVGYQGVVNKKFPSIPPRLENDYHSISDYIPLVSVYTMRNVTVQEMLISDAFLTKEISATNDYKEYETVFVNVAIPMNQPQSIFSTQGTHSNYQTKASGQMGKKESYADKFPASMIHNDDGDFEDWIEPGSHKEHPEVVVDEMIIRKRKKMMRWDIAHELTDNVLLSTATTSKYPHRISSKYSHLPGALRRMCRRQRYMIKDMERKCVTTDEFWKVHGKFDQLLNEIISQLAGRATNDLIEGNLKRFVVEIVIQELDTLQAEVPALIYKEYDAQAPQIIEELFKTYVQNNVIQVHQDDAPPEGEKRVKRHKTSKSSKSTRGSSSKRSAKDSTNYVIQDGNSLKRTRRDHAERVIILPPTTADEHIAVQRESKARTTLLSSIPDDHVADFHYMDDARDIWNAVKARFGGNAESKKIRKSILKQEFLEFRIGKAGGLHKGYDRMQKILSRLNQLKAKPEDEDINLMFLRALPSSWSQVALTLKTKGRLELLSFDDLYYKLKTLRVDVKGYTTFFSSQSAGPSHSAFVSTTSAGKKISYRDSLSYSLTITYTAPSNSKIECYRSGNVIEDVLQSFVADTEPEQQLAYEDFKQIEKLDLEEMDLKWQMAMLSVRVHKFEKKVGRKIVFDKKESARFNKKKVRCYKCQQRGHFARECRAKGGNDKQIYSSFKIKEIGKKEEDSKALITVDTLVDWTDHDGESDRVIASKEFGMIAGFDTEDAIEEGAAKIYNLITGADTKEASTAGDAGEFALMGVTSETKLDNHVVQTKKWRISSKNMFRLIDSSMSVRTKVGFRFNNYIRENELGWDDSAFSVFTTTSEDVEGRPLFNGFAKADSMKAVPLPLSGDYTSLSDHIDLDESQMYYGIKSSTSSVSKSVSNDFVSCDDSDKSSE